MSNIDRKQLLTAIIAAITVLFGIGELLIAGGFITVEQTGGFLSNLREGGTNWYLNPIPWVIVLVVVVNFFGFAENWTVDPQHWDIKKFGETWFKYLPMVIFFSQVPWGNFIPGITDIPAANIAISSAISLAIDIITRAIKSLGNGTSASSVATPVSAA